MEDIYIYIYNMGRYSKQKTYGIVKSIPPYAKKTHYKLATLVL